MLAIVRQNANITRIGNSPQSFFIIGSGADFLTNFRLSFKEKKSDFTASIVRYSKTACPGNTSPNTMVAILNRLR